MWETCPGLGVRRKSAEQVREGDGTPGVPTSYTWLAAFHISSFTPQKVQPLEATSQRQPEQKCIHSGVKVTLIICLGNSFLVSNSIQKTIL